MESEVGNQPKHERSRTRWTASLDKIFADLVVEQIQLGNRPNNVFDKKTWNHIRDEFNKQTDLNFNNNQLRKHLDVLRTRFYNLKSTYDQSNDFTLDESCCVGFDLWEDIGAQPRPETIKAKDCPIYEQLCTIFTDSSADGKYAQSSHYEELDKSAGMENGVLSSCPGGETQRSENPPSSRPAQVNMSSAEKVVKVMPERKKKRPSERESSSGQSRRDQEICDAMAQAMLDMLAASRSRRVGSAPSDNRFTITNCIKALDELEGIDQQTYFAALDLFEDPNLRETFISLKGEKIRLTWLQGKCSKTSSTWVRI
ncbi:Myb/SANT-like domain containing protein [Parasponia andersonii]|uniref:Myb/SANT-like domain containing protein n=1 Tax=Parasponia andersonii TaxID=3476 RepID=A0A2P5C6Q1_PARAD|nr:Myb/SANT-like domain containing protein [Parasponia andersonii]